MGCNGIHYIVSVILRSLQNVVRAQDSTDPNESAICPGRNPGFQRTCDFVQDKPLEGFVQLKVLCTIEWIVPDEYVIARQQ